MALEDYLSTPSGYATPDQLASVRQYADLLMKGGQRDQPITSPWQGVGMMADTLAGKSAMGQAGQQQMAGIQNYTNRLEQAPGSTGSIGQTSDIRIPTPGSAPPQAL